MIIDFHTHIWNDQMHDIDTFIKGLDEGGIDKACVLPIAPYMSNEDIAKLVEKHPDRLIGFASVVPFSQTTGIPRTDPSEELRHAVEDLGMKGLKIHPLIQGFKIDDPGLVPLMTTAAELDIPVLLHTGPNMGKAGRSANGKVELIEDLALMCPNTTIVAGHADPLDIATPYMAASMPNVYLEPSISWTKRHEILPKLAAQVIEIAGASKVLYGTDYSIGRGQRVTDINDMLDDCHLSAEDRDLIESGNARRLLKI
ncbi:amidohydrolase family protein [Microbacterium soli]|uniref:Amidohydrolase-related domain-containing protein n=1 Tax=Microbacterium soli TaxID=446075 RepID=A0ABP7N112_9MICO